MAEENRAEVNFELVERLAEREERDWTCILRPRGFRNNGISSVPLGGVLSLNLMASEEELKAEIARLRAENEALQRPVRGQMSLKVSEKGALSVYGLGRFPVTLYREQWEKLLGMADEIRAFIQENDRALKKKE
jgi:hypothetical protein